MAKSLLLLITLALAIIPVQSYGQILEGSTLLESARLHSDIFSGSKPFRLAAIVEHGLLPGVRGEYVLYWEDPGDWREEVVFGKAREVRLARAGKMWILRASRDAFPAVDWIFELRNFAIDLRLTPEMSVRKIKEVKFKGLRYRCVQVQWGPDKLDRCIDEAGRYVGDLKSTTYGDFRLVGDKEFPFKWEFGSARVTVKSIVADRHPNAEWQAITPTFKQHDGCFDMTPPHPLQKVRPDFPQIAKSARVIGKVVVEATILPDGRVGEAMARSGHPMLVDSSVDAVTRWRFAPARCGGEAISTSLPVEVYYDASLLR
jgi:TonB family protein